MGSFVRFYGDRSCYEYRCARSGSVTQNLEFFVISLAARIMRGPKVRLLAIFEGLLSEFEELANLI